MARLKNQSAALKKVGSRVKKYYGAMLLSLVLSLFCVAMSLGIPILVGRAVDSILAPGRVDFPRVAELLSCVAGCAFAAGLCQWLMNINNNRITFRVSRELRDEAFSHIQQLPLSYLDSHPRGDTLSRVVADVDTFADGLLLGSTQLFTGVMTIVCTLLIMVCIHPGIALLVICITPLSLLVANFIARRSYRMFRLQTETRGEQTALINESLEGLSVVRAFGYEKKLLETFDENNSRLTDCSLKAIFFSSLTNPCTRFVNSLVYAGVGVTGALMALSGSITVGSLTVFLNYANQYTKPFNEISGVVTELQNALAAADRVFALLEEPGLPPEPEEGEPLSIRGDLEIRDLAFSYDREKPLLRDLSLHAKPGQRIALVGPTGCGKTTFINLLMRFYEPDQGRILVDGRDISTIPPRTLRSSVGMVLQDTWLRSGTIRENIAL